VRTNRHIYTEFATSMIAMTAFVFSAAAHAQNAAGGPAAAGGEGTSVNDIVVTAQRRSERLQDVPISIAVMSGAKLEQAGAASGTSDILGGVAGVSVSATTQNGGTLITMRGVSAGNQNLNGASTVGFYIDALPFGFVKSAIAPNIAIYDLDRVEVLRGPQGTLYGASSQNGVVRVLTKDVNLDKFEYKARGSVATTHKGDESYQGDAAVNIPIIDDVLGVRLVAGYHDMGGWLDRATQKDANHSELKDFRGRVRFEPNDRLKIGLSAWLSSQHDGAPSGAELPYRATNLIDEPASTRIHQYGATVDYDFDGFSASAASGLLRYNSKAILDYAPPLPATFLDSRFISRVESHELNFRSTTTGDWRWTAGGIYRNARDRFFGDRRGLIPAPPIDYVDASKSYAFFGELTHLMFDRRLELMIGLRYFHDRVRTYELQPGNGIPGTPLASFTAKSKKASPRIVATFHADRNLTFYASYSEGFRSGYPQIPSVTAAAPTIPSARPDNLKNYEIGSKGSLFDGRLTFDSALYYIKWIDVQQVLKVPLNGTFYAAVVNGTGASGVGVDLSVAAQLTRRLRLSGGFDWNDLSADADVFSGGALLLGKGQRLDMSPEYTGNVGLDYSVPLSSELDGTFSVSGNFNGKLYQRTIGFADSSESLFTAKANFALQKGDQWTASVYVDNLTNVTKVVAPSNIANLFPNWRQRTRPRTIGFQMEYRY